MIRSLPKPRKEKRPKIVRDPKLRALVYERDKGVCAVCQVYDKDWIHEHIRALWATGPDTLENSETRCRRHATEKTSVEATQRAKADRLNAKHERTKRRKQIRVST